MSDKMTHGYLDELQAEIGEETAKLGQINSDIAKFENKLGSIRTFSCPFEYDHKDNISLLNSDFLINWKTYKSYLHSKWENQYKRNRLITAGYERYIQYIFFILTAAFITLALYTRKYKDLYQINAFSFIMLVYGVYEIISYVVSAYYFVIRPNRINKANYRLEIRKLKAEQKVIQAKIDTDKGLIDAHKIASLKPEKEVANIKAKNITSLKEIISDTRSEIIPKMNQAYRDRYEVILDKCSSLLSMAEENGSILVEISKIYNIYLNDINSIVMKATDENCNDIITMLDNFERYIDRKIEKFKNINDFSVQSEISTLNNIFNEDIKG